MPIKQHTYTRLELIEIMQRRAKELRKTPTLTDWQNAGFHPGWPVYVQVFGDWDAACRAAGLAV